MTTAELIFLFLQFTIPTAIANYVAHLWLKKSSGDALLAYVIGGAVAAVVYVAMSMYWNFLNAGGQP